MSRPNLLIKISQVYSCSHYSFITLMLVYQVDQQHFTQRAQSEMADNPTAEMDCISYRYHASFLCLALFTNG